MRENEVTKTLNNLTIGTVGAYLGLKLPNRGMARCPLPDHDDRTPSFEVRHHGRRWVCYACDKRGGAIDLVMACKGMKFLEARNWLANQAGLFGSKSRSYRRSLVPIKGTQHQPPANAALSDKIQADFSLYRQFLLRAPLQETGAEYLRKRGILQPVIDRFAIGQMPDYSLMQQMVALFGFDRVQRSGLLTQKSTSARYCSIFPKAALLFPFFENGQITYFQSRGISDFDKNNRWRNLYNHSRRIYNIDSLFDSNVERIAICEGVIDTLSAIQMKCEAIGFIGVSAKLSGSEMKLLRSKQVDILLDWDDAGERRAVNLQKELSRYGVVSTRRTAPRNGAKDVNDFLREGNSTI